MTVEIRLTQGKVALIDDEDYMLVGLKKWSAVLQNNNWYAITWKRKEDGTPGKLYMHRLILGLTDSKIQGEHRDGNGLNNQRSNLRICTYAENVRNRGIQINNISGCKGVSFNKQSGKWIAQICFNGKRRYLGIYRTPEAAYQAYCKAAKELHGNFANLG